MHNKVAIAAEIAVRPKGESMASVQVKMPLGSTHTSLKIGKLRKCVLLRLRLFYARAVNRAVVILPLFACAAMPKAECLGGAKRGQLVHTEGLKGRLD